MVEDLLGYQFQEQDYIVMAVVGFLIYIGSCLLVGHIRNRWWAKRNRRLEDSRDQVRVR